ncbi:uncharacterized protein F5Z01DRAFT_656656 [Emericellopsis atlantica]|uniref:Zn(2)-C6 fungal-type domain-containing protein n=1 Tax=Emericellopsis atlantica TaxID=2614577 RepID=A0A9P7ZL71_9HYPO|nr:uncharacterized protein F5Z01DRAFT_656656 [Emericellopsis atlantica]KAG9253762.1 hypothetical protein F5Z01DRAFT_656656 [Emericellopsis atlantica]
MSLQTPRSRPDDSEMSTPPKKRRRPALACLQCRRRKIRCDQQKPCTNCTKSKIPDCEFPDTHVPGSAGPSHQPEGSIAPRTASQPVWSSREPSEGIGAREASEHRLSDAPAVAHRPALHHDSSHAALLNRITELEKTVSRLSQPATSQAGGTGAGVTPAVNNGHQGHRFVAQSSWINSTSLYFNILQPISQAQTEDCPLISAMADCKKIGDRIEKHIFQPLPLGESEDQEARILYQKADIDVLLDGYLQTFEGCLRILDVPTFRSNYEEYWRHTNGPSEVFVLQLHVCLALGSVALPNALRWRNAAHQWLLRAQAWLSKSKTRIEKQMTIEEIQLACLVLLAELNSASADHMHPCWVNMGNLVRKAMCMDLHRDPARMEHMTRRRSEIRRRLWATILELNLLVSLQAGKPPLITEADYDTPPPSNISDDDLADDVLPHVVSNPNSGHRTDTTVQLSLFQSFKLRSVIVSKISRLGPAMAYDEMLELHAELSMVWARIREDFDLPDWKYWPNTHPVTRAQGLLAEVFFDRYFLALHLPALGPSIRDPRFHFSRRFCFDTAVYMLQATGILGWSILEYKQSDLAPLFKNSPGFFRHIIMQAAFAVALETVTQAEEWADNEGVFSVCTADRLDTYMANVYEWAVARMQSGLIDVRTQIFLNVCWQYADVVMGNRSMTPDQRASFVVDEAARTASNSIPMLLHVASKAGLPSEETPGKLSGAVTSGSLFTPLHPRDALLDWPGGFLSQDLDTLDLAWGLEDDSQLGGADGTNFGSMASM